MTQKKKIELAELRDLRYLLGITLDEVSNELGISVGYLSRIESGHIKSIKNTYKEERLIKYIQKLKKKAKYKLDKIHFGR